MNNNLITILPSDKAIVAIAPSPFSTRRNVYIVEPGSVEALIREARLPINVPARVFVNDRLIPYADRSLIVVKPGEILTIRAIPGSGQSGKATFLQLAVVVAAAAATWYVGGAGGPLAAAGMSGMSLSVGGALAGAAVGLVGSLLTRALVPPPSSPGPSYSANPARFTISGTSNVAAPFAALPVVYGQRLVTPMMAAAPYTELVGRDQFLRQLFVLGYGPLNISSLQIKDTPLEHFEDVQWEIREGFPDDSPPRLYLGSVTEQDINVALALGNVKAAPTLEGWQLQTSGEGADELCVNISFPSGLVTIGKGNGAQLPFQYTVQIRWAPTGTTDWTNEPDFVIRASSSSEILRGHQWRLPNGQYDVEVQVIRPVIYKNDYSNPYVADCYWTALKTIRDQSPFTKCGLALIALRIRASHQLNGNVSQLNCIATSILRDWNPATETWDQLAGAWDYDWDNAGNGGSYTLDPTHVHTTDALTDKRWITDEVIGVGNGVLETFNFMIQKLPIDPGSFVISIGDDAAVNSGLGFRKKGGLPQGAGYISDDGMGTINGPTVASGTIDYQTGAGSITFTAAAPDAINLTADYIQQIRTAGAGRSLAIKTAAGTDQAAVASKSIPVHILKFDETTGLQVPPVYSISVWYKASANIGAGVRVRAYFSPTEDFAVGDAGVTHQDIVSNGAATGGWANATAQITAPQTAPKGSYGEPQWMRIVVYHLADATGGVTLYFDDVWVNHVDTAEGAVNICPNPSFDFPGVQTSNPASHFRDVLQGRANKLAMADDRVDLPAIQNWWSINATAGRYFNGIIDKQGTVFDTLRMIASSARAAFGMNGGLYSVVLDQPQTTPIQHFTPRNSWGFKSVRAMPNLPDALRVRFIDPTLNWQPNERIAYDDGFDASSAYLFEALDLTQSCTDRNQAWREGRYHLAQGRLRPETYTLQVDVENMVCQRGDLVRVAHDVPQWGLGWARVKSVQRDGSGDATGVTFDEAMELDPANTYVLRFRRSDGTSITVNVAAVTETATVNVLPFTAAIPAANPLPDVGDLAMFGLLGAETVELLVTKITPGPDLSATLELVDYSPAIYTADQTIPAVYNQQTQALDDGVAPVITAVQSDDTVSPRDADGSIDARIVLTIAPAVAVQIKGGNITGLQAEFQRSATDTTTNDAAAWSGATNYVIGDTVTESLYVWVAVQPSLNQQPGVALDGSGNPYWTILRTDGQWVIMPVQSANGSQASYLTIDGVDPGVAYDYQVRWVYRDGSFSDWSLATTVVAGQVTPPNDVTNLAAKMHNGNLTLSWTASTSPNVREYEIRQGASWAAGTMVALVRTTKFALLDPASAATYWVATVDTSGNYSSMPQSISVGMEDTMDIYSITHANSPWAVPSTVTRAFIGVDTSAGAVEIDLRGALGLATELYIKKLTSDANAVSVKPGGTDTIDGVNASYAINGQNEAHGFLDEAAGAWEVFV